MLNSTLFPAEVTVQPRRWPRRAVILGLVSASTATLLLCPCDCPGQSPHALFLIALSVSFSGGAAALVYWELRQRSDITAFLKTVIAMALVYAGVYVEFSLAMDAIAWLARPGS